MNTGHACGGGGDCVTLSHTNMAEVCVVRVTFLVLVLWGSLCENSICYTLIVVHFSVCIFQVRVFKNYNPIYWESDSLH